MRKIFYLLLLVSSVSYGQSTATITLTPANASNTYPTIAVFLDSLLHHDARLAAIEAQGVGGGEGGSGVILGETSTTAYRGDRGKVAYDHSLSTANPHSVTKTQVGLGSVDNTSDATKNSATVTLTNKTISGSSNTITNLNASNLASGTAPPSRLGTGTPSSSNFLRGDGTWATPSGGGSSTWGGITGTLSSQTDLQSALNAKQATLISGTNIKTINGLDLTGSGNISISSGSGGMTEDEVNALIAKDGLLFAVDFGVKNSDLHPEITSGTVGTGYPLSVYYSTLSLAQVDFPTATALSDIIDGLAVQNALDFGLYGGSASRIPVIKMPSGPMYFSRPLQGSYGIPFTDFEGQTRNYSSFVLLGAKSSAGKGNASTEKGTVIIPLYKGNMAINVQGGNKVILKDFSISGTNTSIPKNGGLYGFNAQNQANYISPNNSSTDGVPSGFTVEKYRYAPPAGITIDAYSGHPSAWETPPGGVTYVPYDTVVINPLYFSAGQRTQWWKNVSTDVWIENVDIRNFIAGIVVHPNGSDGNGDFVRIKKCIVFNCMVGFAPCQSQARLSTIDDSQFDANWVTVACDMFGKRQGRFMGGSNTHVSGHKILSISNMSVNGPLQLDRWYWESMGRIGDCGYEIANTSSPVLNSCDGNFGHQESGWVPLNIYTGYSITLNNTRLYGRNIDLSCELPPTINNCLLEVVPSGAYNSVYNFDTDVNTNGYYYKAFFNHPIATGTAKKIYATGNNVTQVHINKYILNQNTFGSNAYPYPEQPGNSPGYTGRLGDYNWSSGSLTIGNAYTSFTGGHLVINVANIGLARDIQKALINKGDEFTIPTYGFKFMVYARSGNTVDAVLLNGFTEGYTKYFVGDSSLGAMQTLLSNTDLNWTWFNNNWYDVAPPLSGGRQWAIKGTATAGSPIITGVDYVDGIENGSRAAASTHFQLGTAVHYYTYSASPLIPTNEMGTAVVSSTTTGQVTMDRNSTVTGTILLYNKFPYDKR